MIVDPQILRYQLGILVMVSKLSSYGPVELGQRTLRKVPTGVDRQGFPVRGKVVVINPRVGEFQEVLGLV
jgi:hypothetical protein